MWLLAKSRAAGFWQAFAGDPYHPALYRLASVALAVASTTALYALIHKRARMMNLWARRAVVLAAAHDCHRRLHARRDVSLFLWPMFFSTIALRHFSLPSRGARYQLARSCVGLSRCLD